MSEIVVKDYNYVKAIAERDLEIANLTAERDALHAELATYTGPRAIVDRFPHHTRIRIFDRQEDADERRKY